MALPKGVDDVRPIAVGETLPRLAAKSFAAEVKKQKHPAPWGSRWGVGGGRCGIEAGTTLSDTTAGTPMEQGGGSRREQFGKNKGAEEGSMFKKARLQKVGNECTTKTKGKVGEPMHRLFLHLARKIWRLSAKKPKNR